MSNKRFDAMSPRKGKDGKTFWNRVGVAWQSDKGIQVVLEAYPLPDEEGRCVINLFEPRDDRAKSTSRDQADARQRAGGYDDGSDVPF